MTRVSALDGLRAVAVGLVVAKHLDVPSMDGAWIGVDIFFVLSGYLITTLLVAEHDRTGRIRLGEFWLRRFARLDPALVLMVLVAVAIDREAFEGVYGVRGSVLVALTWTQDLTRFLSTGFGGFDHTWSLGVEQQFYLVWPVVAVVCRGRRGVLGAVGSLLVAAGVWRLVASAGQTPPDEGVAYYLPHTRGWEIVAGCLLALALPRRAVPARAASAALWAAVPAGIVVVAVAGRTGTPLWVAVLPAVLLALVVVAGLATAAQGGVSRLLAWGPVAWLGRVSYGVYLYHWVAVLGVRPHLPGPGPLVDLVVVAGTVAFAGLSFHAVERPVQQVARGYLARRAAERSTAAAAGAAPTAAGRSPAAAGTG